MRTFPKSLAIFRQIVEERGERLRRMSFEELKQLRTAPIEHLTIDSRAATIAIIVLDSEDCRLEVVVQGFMNARLLPVKNVALDGFYKHANGSVTPLADSEFYKFD